MRLPLRRIAKEKRRVLAPLLGGLVLNVVLYVAVVYPLRIRVASAETRGETAARELIVARNDDAGARAMLQGQDRTGSALQEFYTNVLPVDLAGARRITYLRLYELAEEHDVRIGRRSYADPDNAPQATLSRLRITMTIQGDYENIRQFIYQLESGSEFIVIDDVSLDLGTDPDSPLTLALAISTYYRAEPDGV
jgi:hypothetical protein